MSLLKRPRRAREHVTFVYRKAVIVLKVVTRFAVLFTGVWIFAQLADEVHPEGRPVTVGSGRRCRSRSVTVPR